MTLSQLIAWFPRKPLGAESVLCCGFVVMCWLVVEVIESSQSAAEGGHMLRLAREMIFWGPLLLPPKEQTPTEDAVRLKTFVSFHLSPNAVTLLSRPSSQSLLWPPRAQLSIKNKPVLCLILKISYSLCTGRHACEQYAKTSKFTPTNRTGEERPGAQCPFPSEGLSRLSPEDGERPARSTDTPLLPGFRTCL